MKTKLKPPDPTGELVKVEWEKATEAFLSWSMTEKSISEDRRHIEQAATQHEAQAAIARQGIVEMFEAAGMPNPYKVGLRRESKTKSIYRMPEEKKA